MATSGMTDLQANCSCTGTSPSLSIMALRIKLLGDFRALLGERDVSELTSQPTRAALLVYFAIQGAVSRDQLVGILWPDRDPGAALRQG